MSAMLGESGAAPLEEGPVGATTASAERPPGRSEVVAFSDVVIDIRAQVVRRNGVDVSLSPRAWALLSKLVSRPDEVITRSQLLREVWGYSSDVMTRTVDSHIVELRRKLEVDPANPRHFPPCARRVIASRGTPAVQPPHEDIDVIMVKSWILAVVLVAAMTPIADAAAQGAAYAVVRPRDTTDTSRVKPPSFKRHVSQGAKIGALASVAAIGVAFAWTCLEELMRRVPGASQGCRSFRCDPYRGWRRGGGGGLARQADLLGGDP